MKHRYVITLCMVLGFLFLLNTAAFAAPADPKTIPTNIQMLGLEPGMTLAEAKAIVQKKGGFVKALGPIAAYKDRMPQVRHSSAIVQIFSYRAVIGKRLEYNKDFPHLTPKEIVTGPVIEVDIYTYPTKYGDFTTPENLTIFGLMQSQSFPSSSMSRHVGTYNPASTSELLDALGKQYGDIRGYIPAGRSHFYILEGDTADMPAIGKNILMEPVSDTVQSDGRSYGPTVGISCHHSLNNLIGLVQEGPAPQLMHHGSEVTKDDLIALFNHGNSSQTAFDTLQKCGRHILVHTNLQTGNRAVLHDYSQYYMDIDQWVKANIAITNFYRQYIVK